MGKFIDFSVIRALGRIGIGLAAVSSMTLLFSDPSLPAKDIWIAIKAGRIQTVSQGEIEKGIILIRNDRIEEIGSGVAIPAGAEVFDFGEKFVMPGIVSPDSNLGIVKPPPREMASWGNLRLETAGKNLAFYPVLYSIDPGHPDYSLALRSGLTTLALSPPPAGISGLGAVIRPEGESLRDILVKDRAFLRISVYVNTPFWNMLKGSLEEAQRTLDGQKKKKEEAAAKQKEEKKKKKKASKAEEAEDEPTVSESAKIFMEVIEGKIPILAECAQPAAALHLLELLSGYPNVRLIVRGGAEIYKAGVPLKEKNIPVIIEPGIDSKEDFYKPYPELTNYVLKCQAVGLTIAFQAQGGIEEQILLLDHLNELYRSGVKKDVLFQGITLIPAKLLGIDSSVGSLEKGKKADLIVLKNDPLEDIPVIEKVILGGKFVQ
jgi:imidazolonepropionase-like amidohydrolase